MIANTREHILDSAAALILRDGATSLTLDRVAREAGISKGGLLYHFSAKELLIHALFERMIERFDADLAKHERNEPESSPGRRTRAFVRAALQGASHQKARLCAGLLATISNDPALLEPLRVRYSRWQAVFERDDLPPARATVVRLAADGLWFAELLGLASFDPAQRREIVNEILSLTSAPPKVRRPRVKRATA